MTNDCALKGYHWFPFEYRLFYLIMLMTKKSNSWVIKLMELMFIITVPTSSVNFTDMERVVSMRRHNRDLPFPAKDLTNITGLMPNE